MKGTPSPFILRNVGLSILNLDIVIQCDILILYYEVIFSGVKYMVKSILDNLIEKNEFPIIFIGAGISKRYLKNYPSWEQLLEELWSEVNDTNIYSYLNKINENLKTEGIDNEFKRKFIANTLVARDIEKLVNNKFFDGKITIEGLSQENVYKSSISPFKKYLSNKFTDYIIKDKVEKEVNEFSNLLLKAQIIITTNYDTFIEDTYNKKSNYEIKKYIGQQGFFRQTLGYAELYKIHGCVTEPTSVIINDNDYKNFNNNSILISAKIISLLLNSPIIFLGYSLTDVNVRNIIKDFTGSLSEHEKVELEKRLILVQWMEGINDILEEVIIDTDLGCRLTLIKTDNYYEVFRKISQINQGVAPSEVRRYQSVIRELIVERGKKGSLKAMLVSPGDLDEIEKTIGNKNIVVAIGDSKTIFNMPNTVDYIYDYIEGVNEQNINSILRFIASQQTKSILPVLKYITDENIDKCNLHDSEKKKLRKRIKKQAILRVQNEALPCKEVFKTIEDILKEKYPKYREQSLIAYNIDIIGTEKVRNYLLNELNDLKTKGEITASTQLKRLALIYDLKVTRKDIVVE